MEIDLVVFSTCITLGMGAEYILDLYVLTRRARVGIWLMWLLLALVASLAAGSLSNPRLVLLVGSFAPLTGRFLGHLALRAHWRHHHHNLPVAELRAEQLVKSRV